MVIPDFLKKENLKTFNDAYNMCLKNSILSDRYTTLPTKLNNMMCLQTVAADVTDRVWPSKKEYDASIAKVMEKVVGLALPQAHQIWIISEVFVTAAYNFMTTVVGNSLDTEYKKYMKKDADTSDAGPAIEKYVDLVEQFRQLNIFFHDGEPIPGFETLVGDVASELRVDMNQLGPLKEMLDMMNKQRDQMLKRKAPIKRTKATHVDEYMAFVNAENSDDFISSVDAFKKNKDGYYLLATAIAYQAQIRGEDEEKMFTKLKKFEGELPKIKEVVDQAKTFIDQDRQQRQQWEQSAFKSQKSNIDSVFLTFFIAFRICKLTIDTFYDWQRIMVAVGGRVRGRQSLKAFLSTWQSKPGIQPLIDNMSENTDIHLPPFIINYARMQDIYCCVGPLDCKVKNPWSKSGAVSYRYLTNIESPYNLNIIIMIFNIEKAAEEKFPSEKPIYQSMHQLHQALLRKTSPFQCSNFVFGNALNVEVIPVDTQSNYISDLSLTFWNNWLTSSTATAANLERVNLESEFEKKLIEENSKGGEYAARAKKWAVKIRNRYLKSKKENVANTKIMKTDSVYKLD